MLKQEQIPSILALKEIDYKEIYDRTSNYLMSLELAAEEVIKFDIDFTKLNEDERKMLGFRTWSKDSEEAGLIPLYLVELIPGDTKVFCPLFEKSEPEFISRVNTDIRAGCIAYQFYRKG